MNRRLLEKDLEVSAVGLGTMGFTHAYGLAMNDKDSIQLSGQRITEF